MRCNTSETHYVAAGRGFLIYNGVGAPNVATKVFFRFLPHSKLL